MQSRNIATQIILTIVTCGLYGIYWLYTLGNDIGQLEDGDPKGGRVLLLSLVTCGIYTIFFFYKSGTVLEKYTRKNDGVLYLVLSLVGLAIISYALIQNEINTVINTPTMNEQQISSSTQGYETVEDEDYSEYKENYYPSNDKDADVDNTEVMDQSDKSHDAETEEFEESKIVLQDDEFDDSKITEDPDLKL